MKFMTDAAIEAVKTTAAEVALDQFKHILYPVMLVGLVGTLVAGFWLGHAKGKKDFSEFPGIKHI
jgi:hypothetical protein